MSIAYILNTLRRRWLTVLLAVLVAALAGVAFAEAAPDRYAATASLVVTPVVSNPMTGSREDVNIRTEQEILGSRAVAARAADSLGIPLESGSYLRADVETAAPSGSQILQVTVGANNPAEAAAGANAIAEAYLEFRRETTENVSVQYIEGIDEQIADLRSQPASPAIESLIATLQQQRSSLALSNTEPGRIIGVASPPNSPSGPGAMITTAGVAMAGLLLGIAAAVSRERFDPRVRSADRLEMALGPLPIVTSRSEPNEQFWVRLADEAIQRSLIDTDSAPVRVLLQTVAPMPSQVVTQQFRSAAGWILLDPRTEALRPDGSERNESAPCSTKDSVEIVAAGMYRSSLAQAARRSDISVIAVSQRASLSEVAELVSALRGSGLEVVIGLSKEPQPTSRRSLKRLAKRHAPDERYQERATEQQELAATSSGT